MADGSAIRPADLIPRDELKALHQRTNWQGLIHITLQLALLGGSGLSGGGPVLDEGGVMELCAPLVPEGWSDDPR